MIYGPTTTACTPNHLTQIFFDLFFYYIFSKVLFYHKFMTVKTQKFKVVPQKFLFTKNLVLISIL
jgi:hypothetical protein